MDGHECLGAFEQRLKRTRLACREGKCQRAQCRRFPTAAASWRVWTRLPGAEHAGPSMPGRQPSAAGANQKNAKNVVGVTIDEAFDRSLAARTVRHLALIAALACAAWLRPSRTRNPFNCRPLQIRRTWSITGKGDLADLITPDLAASKRFYGGLFGWSFQDIRVGNAAYAVATLGGHPVAGLFENPLEPASIDNPRGSRSSRCAISSRRAAWRLRTAPNCWRRQKPMRIEGPRPYSPTRKGRSSRRSPRAAAMGRLSCGAGRMDLELAPDR